MPKLPALSGQEVIRALERIGFVKVSQSGSHVKLRDGSKTCIVPMHKEIKKGTLSGILRQADISAGQLLKALTQ